MIGRSDEMKENIEQGAREAGNRVGLYSVWTRYPK